MKHGLHDLYSFFFFFLKLETVQYFTDTNWSTKRIYCIRICCTNSIKLSFNIYIYTIQFLEKVSKRIKIYSFYFFSFIYHIIQEMLQDKDDKKF